METERSSPMTLLGLGTDIVDVERIARLVDRGGERFWTHWYRPDEIKACATSSRPDRAAARCFAVKEATLKAIGVSLDGHLPWRDIEVRTHQEGHVSVRLWGHPAEHASRAGVVRLHASTGRAGHRVVAVVVAEG